MNGLGQWRCRPRLARELNEEFSKMASVDLNVLWAIAPWDTPVRTTMKRWEGCSRHSSFMSNGGG